MRAMAVTKCVGKLRLKNNYPAKFIGNDATNGQKVRSLL